MPSQDDLKKAGGNLTGTQFFARLMQKDALGDDAFRARFEAELDQAGETRKQRNREKARRRAKA